MKRVAHVVVTPNFAGTERYVATTSNELARRGWRVDVIGGDPTRMRAELSSDVAWSPGHTPATAARSLWRLGRLDVCHAHLTLAEAVAVGLKPRHQGVVVSTRHIAVRRGSSPLGRLAAPVISRYVDRTIAISHFVASCMEAPPDLVIHNGIAIGTPTWRPENRTVLVMQRLEPDKNTKMALDIWAASGLAQAGWRMEILGEGSEREILREVMREEGIEGVELLGHVSDVSPYLARAGLMLATTLNEGLGLAVLEGMAAGIPVIATRSGGHLEILDENADNLYRPRDVKFAARRLRLLAEDSALRSRESSKVFRRAESRFLEAISIDTLESAYACL